tara:strand:+ start:284 stop:1018 length:735 start_codon:yes stop_codon:yes gene_type:complete
LQHSNSHTIKFILLLTIVVSFLLSITSTQLAYLQKKNVDIDRKKNLLKSIGIDVSDFDSEKILREYNIRISDVIIHLNGEIATNIKFEDLDLIENKATGGINYFKNEKEYLPLYSSSNPLAIIVPISGKGLWSTLYGYIALEPDFNTIKGITFYKHGETPGLGGEVEKEWFQANFVGKKIYNLEEELISVAVVKGKASDVLADADLAHGVDGISGATITSNGVTEFLRRDLNRYKQYFKRNRTN